MPPVWPGAMEAGSNIAGKIAAIKPTATSIPAAGAREKGTFLNGGVYLDIMKHLRCVLVLISLLSGAVVAKSQTTDPQSEYARAVRTYVDAATEETRALRGQVDAQVASITDNDAKKRFDAVYAKIETCDKLLVELKKSGPTDFDKIKLKFERARADAVKTLAALTKG